MNKNIFVVLSIVFIALFFYLIGTMCGKKKENEKDFYLIYYYKQDHGMKDIFSAGVHRIPGPIALMSSFPGLFYAVRQKNGKMITRNDKSTTALGLELNIINFCNNEKNIRYTRVIPDSEVYVLHVIIFNDGKISNEAIFTSTKFSLHDEGDKIAPIISEYIKFFNIGDI